MSYYDMAAMEAYIRKAALARGMNPDIAVKVGRSEGFVKGIWQSIYKKNGIQEPSYGPFQMLVGGKGTGFPEGLGNRFIKDTGLDPRNPSNVYATVDYALNEASQKGWGQWYGAKRVGVGRWDGIRNSGATPTTAPVQVPTNAVAYTSAPARAAAGTGAASVPNATIPNPTVNPVVAAPTAQPSYAPVKSSNPFGGLMQAMMMQQMMAQPQVPTHTNVIQQNDGPDLTALQQMPQNPRDQLAMVSMTPNAYYGRRRRAISYG